ncbi:MAG: cupin domain-containing protein [Deltaproteobacteria bacterium]|jgi:mannose-6-phosphate isomerase-like protein (cupin superfamily)|nr:cupin domain-containing protein [Deltaproteobacteria bacterium]
MSERHIFLLDAIQPVEMQQMRGGKGSALWRTAVGEANATPGSPFAKVGVNILLPGSSVGMHKHVGDAEVYVIISGSGMYSCRDANGVSRQIRVKAGDVTVCYDGEEHGLENDGTEPLMMSGVIG